MDLSRLKTTRTIANLKQGRNDWYRITKNQVGGLPTQVMIYDEVGFWGVTASDFIDEMKGISGPIDLHLNSPGGEVYDGIAIFQYLSGRGDVTTYVDSLAASIASVIAMAGTEIVMGRNASFMVHDGYSLCIGNAADMREQADLLDRVSDNIASIYADRTGKPVDEWRKAMLAETWYIGQEAVDAGLADRLAPAAASTKAQPAQDEPNQGEESSKRMAAHFDLSMFRNVPSRLTNITNQIEPPTAAEPPAPQEPTPEPTPPPPATEQPAIEAPADTDRGFVVPEAQVDADPGPEPQGDAPPTQPAAAPDADTVTIDVSGGGVTGDEVLAWLRENIRFRAQPPAEPLGTETMPLLNKAIPVHHTDTVDTPWDGPAAVAAMPAEYADLHYCHAWQSAEADASSHTEGDDDADDKKSSFKVPHHAKKGGPANLAACRNGLARLSNTNIPEADKAGVKAHLQAHLDDAHGDDGDSATNHTHQHPTNHTHDEPGFAWGPSMIAAFKEAMQ